MAQRVEDAGNNFYQGNIFHKTPDQIKGVDDVIEICSEHDYDEDGDYIPITVKRKDSESRYDGYEVDLDKNQYYLLV